MNSTFLSSSTCMYVGRVLSVDDRGLVFVVRGTVSCLVYRMVHPVSCIMASF